MYMYMQLYEVISWEEILISSVSAHAFSNNLRLPDQVRHYTV